jgi:hypothetical protein
MAEAWLSYADIAKALGTSPEAARQKAIRNDGRALVLVDLEAEQARSRPDDARSHSCRQAGPHEDPSWTGPLEQ